MSNNLDISQLASSQNNPEVTVNDANGELDAAITVQADFAITNTNARTLTNDELRRTTIFHVIDGAPAPSGAITLTLPAVSRGIMAVLNSTSFAVTVTISGQAVTAPVVASGATTPSLLTTDGVNVRATI